MARVEFSDDYRYRPSAVRQICIKYRAGRAYTVKRECADAAVAAGAGVEIKPPNRAMNKGPVDA